MSYFCLLVGCFGIQDEGDTFCKFGVNNALTTHLSYTPVTKKEKVNNKNFCRNAQKKKKTFVVDFFFLRISFVVDKRGEMLDSWTPTFR